MNQIGVLKPIALTMHQPALASNMANAPPNAIPPVTYHQYTDSSNPVRINTEKINAIARACRPSFNRTALPFAPILHCIILT